MGKEKEGEEKEWKGRGKREEGREREERGKEWNPNEVSCLWCRPLTGNFLGSATQDRPISR